MSDNNKLYSGYQGAYVVDMSNALIASALSGLHVILLSAPGWGKTAVARQIAGEITKDNVFVRLDPTTGPERIEGLPDPAKALATPPEYFLVVKGTAYDPVAKIVVLDEIYRANDPTLDKLLDLLDRQNVALDKAAVVWATSNFTVESKRNLALADRFGLYVWLRTPSTPDFAAIVYAHMNDLSKPLDLPPGIDIPNWKRVQQVRSFVPTERAKTIIADFLTALAKEAIASRYIPNPRRAAQWSRLLYRYSAHLLDTPDVSTLPDEAIKVLRWAWPTFAEEDHVKWDRVVGAMANTAQVAIDAALMRAFDRFRKIKAEYDSEGGGNNAELNRQFGKALKVAKDNLYSLGDPDSGNIKRAITQLTEGFGNILSGKGV